MKMTTIRNLTNLITFLRLRILVVMNLKTKKRKTT